MALIVPPELPAIVESPSIHLFFADHICLKVRRDTVWCQFAVKRRRGTEIVVLAAAIMTPWQFSESLAALNFEAVKAGLTISGRPKLTIN